MEWPELPIAEMVSRGWLGKARTPIEDVTLADLQANHRWFWGVESDDEIRRVLHPPEARS
jgi:hypothetical protein